MILEGQLEIDRRGVIYFHTKNHGTVLRICGAQQPDQPNLEKHMKAFVKAKGGGLALDLTLVEDRLAAMRHWQLDFYKARDMRSVKDEE